MWCSLMFTSIFNDFNDLNIVVDTEMFEKRMQRHVFVTSGPSISRIGTISVLFNSSRPPKVFNLVSEPKVTKNRP